MRILVTGPSGFVGETLSRRLLAEGHQVRGLAREPQRVAGDLAIEVRRGDILDPDALGAALEGAEVAYYLVHSMEPSTGERFEARERAGAEGFARAASAAGLRRIVYLGGPRPAPGHGSRHLHSRLEVERILRASPCELVALRASLLIGARSRSFLAIVRLIERMPVLVLPSWSTRRTQPIDGRDAVAYLAAAASIAETPSGALDIAGPEVLSYRQMIERIAQRILVRRPAVSLPFALTGVVSSVAARISGEPRELLAPLMESLSGDLLVDDHRTRRLMPVPLHGFDAAVDHALAELETHRPVYAR